MSRAHGVSMISGAIADAWLSAKRLSTVEAWLTSVRERRAQRARPRAQGSPRHRRERRLRHVVRHRRLGGGTIDLTGAVAVPSNMAFSMPRDGTLAQLSVFFSLAVKSLRSSRASRASRASSSSIGRRSPTTSSRRCRVPSCRCPVVAMSGAPVTSTRATSSNRSLLKTGTEMGTVPFANVPITSRPAGRWSATSARASRSRSAPSSISRPRARRS